MAWIKRVYLYVVSLVSLIILMVAAVTLVNLGLKVALHADNTVSYPVCAVPAPADKSAAASCSPAQQQLQQEQQAYDQQNTSAQRKRDFAQSVAMFIVATPVFLYHWRLAKREA